ncbi:MAG: autotransporter outer membrane beta-barrel domain-containing protein [Hyphomicrobiales bacterium]|nr:autotransporter outer membrane beta-barrel domain-containing protein [Hyphomicrobiales bacterium]
MGAPVTYTTAGEVITYSYVITNLTDETIVNITLTDDKIGAVACPSTTLAAASSMTCTGTYTITNADVLAGSVTNTATASGEIIDTSRPADIQATFTVALEISQIQNDTRATIRSFVANRINRLTAAEPDRNRIYRRIPSSLWSNGSTSQATGTSDAFSFSGTQTQAVSQFSFATSLSQLARSFENTDGKTIADGIDVWIEAHYSQYADNIGATNIDGRFGVVFFGADYLLTDAILIGGLVQVDWLTEKGRRTSATRGEGTGVMAGPYVSIRLDQDVYFDARFAWGVSGNSVSPVGIYTDSFSTQRWLASAKLTGNWSSGNFRVTPSVGLIFAEERQESYVDALGLTVAAQTAALGRLVFGPEFAYRHTMPNGLVIEPHMSIMGLWDFNKPGAETAGGFVTAGSDFRATVEAGVIVHSTSGLNVRAVGTYDGIGAAGYESYGGKLWINLPLDPLFDQG